MQYENLITSEHRDKPNYMAMIAASLQPARDCIAELLRFPVLFDLDVATGQQLDVLGEWLNRSRQLPAPIAGVYFGLDLPGLGFDQGIWQGPFDPSTGLTSLPDDHFRMLLKMEVLNNHWDGTKDSAYKIANSVLGQFGYTLYIEDNCNLTMDLGLWGTTIPTTLVRAMLDAGIFEIRPAGIRIENTYVQTIAGPMFAFDLNTPMLAGFDTSSWAAVTINP